MEGVGGRAGVAGLALVGSQPVGREETAPCFGGTGGGTSAPSSSSNRGFGAVGAGGGVAAALVCDDWRRLRFGGSGGGVKLSCGTSPLGAAPFPTGRDGLRTGGTGVCPVPTPFRMDAGRGFGVGRAGRGSPLLGGARVECPLRPATAFNILFRCPGFSMPQAS